MYFHASVSSGLRDTAPMSRAHRNPNMTYNAN